MILSPVITTEGMKNHTVGVVLLAVAILAGSVVFANLSNPDSAIGIGPAYSVSVAIASTVGYLMCPRFTSTVVSWTWPFWLLQIHGIVGLLLFPQNKEAFQQVVSQFLFLSIFALGCAVGGNMRATRVIQRVIVISGLLMTVAYLASVLMGGLQSETVFQPRSYAVLAVLPAIVAAVGIENRKAVPILLTTIMFLGVFLSLSRMALATLVIVLAFTVGVDWKSRAWLRGGVSVTAGVCLLGVLIVYFEPLAGRFVGGDRSLNVGGMSLNTMGRVRVWSALITNLGDKMLTGHGPGSSRELLGKLFGGSILHPHNDYIRILYEYGYVGATLWLVGLTRVLMKLLKLARATATASAVLQHAVRAALGSWVAFTLMMMTDNPMVYVPFQTVLGAVVGLAAGVQQMERQVREMNARTVAEGHSTLKLPVTNRIEIGY